MSIKSYLTEKRMQRAAIMLQDPNRSVKNVAASCGFEDSLYFSRAFSKYFGISPQQYRSQILKEKMKKECRHLSIFDKHYSMDKL